MAIKKVSIIGCGALGIMYASVITENFPECVLRFIADEGRIERYRGSEFYANGILQSFDFTGPEAGDGPSDLVIFMVKYNDLDDAVRLAKNHIGKDTIILSFLNGITSEEIIGGAYDPSRIICSMVAGMDATKAGYSVDFTQTGYVAFGGPSGGNKENLGKLAGFFDKARIKYEIHNDIMKTLWWKYILNTGTNQTSALLRATYGLFQTSKYAENIMSMAMKEAYEILCKMGVGLHEKDLDDCMKLIKTLSPDGKTSMVQDIEAGRPTEIDMFAGTLIKLGEKYDVPVPVNTFLYNAIKALEDVAK